VADGAASPRPRALVVADADSYLKWAVARAHDLASSFDVRVVVVRSAVTPSAEQRNAAVDGRLAEAPALIGLRELARELAAAPPDLLLLACRGPLIQLLLLEELRGRRAARVVATGIPGIWFPPTALGLELRAGCDLVVVHSERERAAVRERLPQGRLAHTGLASLIPEHALGRADRRRVVFAPQALVPAARADRVRLLEALIATAERHPDLDVVIKVRGGAGEAQTHAETASYEELARGRDLPPNLLVARGPLREYLGDCAGFVTVSSTAALEAVAAGVPSLVLEDFGVSAEVINVVFEGSGLLGTLDHLVALEFRTPDPVWAARNYFHSRDDWVDQAQGLLHGSTSAGPMPDPLAGTLRTPWRLQRRAVALGAADDSWRGPLLAPARLVLRAYDAIRAGWRPRVGRANRG